MRKQQSSYRPGLRASIFLRTTPFVLIMLALLAWYSYTTNRRAAVAGLSNQLKSQSAVTATTLNPEVLEFLQPGDEQTRSYKRLIAKLERVRQQTQSSRIVVLATDLSIIADTLAGTRIGDTYYHAESDATEIKDVQAGETASSTLFQDNNKRYYMTGYSPVFATSDSTSDQRTPGVYNGPNNTPKLPVQALVATIASADFFEQLATLRHQWIAIILLATLLVGLTSLFAGKKIAAPVNELVDVVDSIASGDLDTPFIPRGGPDTRRLATQMNVMRIALRERDAEMQLMLSGIAHEVRNPLGGIKLFAGLLRSELHDQPDILSKVQRIDSEIDYLQNVVDTFLGYAREKPLELMPHSLDDLVLDAVQFVRNDAGTDVSISTPDPKNTVVYVDRHQFHGVLINIIKNAVQASAQGDTVVISMSETEDTASIAIQDHGVGMSDDVQSQVFQPFFTTKEKGSGLGLALAKKTCDQHDGQLRIVSTPGEGTCVIIDLLKKTR